MSGWDMKGDKLVFTHRSEMAQLELPPGTVLEVELVLELEGEVCHIVMVGSPGEKALCMILGERNILGSLHQLIPRNIPIKDNQENLCTGFNPVFTYVTSDERRHLYSDSLC